MVTTRPQAAAAADLLRTIAPGWDASATTNVVLKACEEHTFRDVIYAAITQASNPDNRSPNTILWDGPHWPPAEAQRQRDRSGQRAEQATRRMCDQCDDRGYTTTGARCAHGTLRTGASEQAKAQARQAVAAARAKAIHPPDES